MEKALRDSLASAEERHWWFEGRRQVIASFMDHHQRGTPLVEVGCGNGANLELLSGFGPITGIEPDPGDFERARSRGCGTVLQGSLPDSMPVDLGTFDTVLALDVIEHIQGDRSALTGLAKLLKPGGRLLVTVPANPWMWSKHDTRNGHFRRYTATSLRTVLEAAGLKIDRLSYFNTLLLPLVALIRVAGRPVGMDGAGTEVPYAPLNWMLMKLLASESRLLRRLDLPVGVSLIALAQQKPIQAAR